MEKQQDVAMMSVIERAIEGRERILHCLHLLKGEDEDVILLELQKRYHQKYCEFLNKAELRKYFGKGHIRQVFEKFMQKDIAMKTDVEQTGSLYMRMKRPLAVALADKSQCVAALTPPVAEPMAPYKPNLVPVTGFRAADKFALENHVPVADPVQQAVQHLPANPRQFVSLEEEDGGDMVDLADFGITSATTDYKQEKQRETEQIIRSAQMKKPFKKTYSQIMNSISLPQPGSDEEDDEEEQIRDSELERDDLLLQSRPFSLQEKQTAAPKTTAKNNNNNVTAMAKPQTATFMQKVLQRRQEQEREEEWRQQEEEALAAAMRAAAAEEDEEAERLKRKEATRQRLIAQREEQRAERRAMEAKKAAEAQRYGGNLMSSSSSDEEEDEEDESADEVEQQQQKNAEMHAPLVDLGETRQLSQFQEPLTSSGGNTSPGEELHDPVDERFYANMTGTVAAAPKAKKKLENSECWLFVAIFCQEMAKRKAIMVRDLHTHLGTCRGLKFGDVFPEPADLVQFVQAHCKLINCVQFGAEPSDVVLSWSEEGDEEMDKLQMKVGKILSKK